jgi:hypothetical protein
MATKGNYHEHWIYGNVEERVLLLAIITLVSWAPLIIIWLRW